ncbi:MAG: hypothetical protein H6Q03_1308 [Acidobacteria bacterium]|jgi:hypothetical protein|nr:hypothetical protein [Acidobacteriota bacterium]
MRLPRHRYLTTIAAFALAGTAAAQEGSVVVLFDNGPLLTHPAGGCAGNDLSAAQNTTLGLTSRGFNHSVSGDFRVADDFVVDPPGWELDQVELYAYQGGSTTASPITAVNYQIWDGSPDDPLAVVVCGDPTTNRMSTTEWTSMWRALLSEATTDCTRPIMRQNVDAVGCLLPPGTYWIDWQTDGDIAFTGPWAPPIAVLDQNPPGNALQQVAGTWQAVVDAALLTPLDLPFVIHGTANGLVFRDGFESGDTSRWTAAFP